MSELIRRCRFTPYRKGAGPSFTLKMYDPGMRQGGKDIVGYRLLMSGESEPLFAGNDHGCSPLHAIDSDETVASLMCFLTLKPGDTDSKYFANYTERQRNFCAEHAESLHAEVDRRFNKTDR